MAATVKWPPSTVARILAGVSLLHIAACMATPANTLVSEPSDDPGVDQNPSAAGLLGNRVLGTSIPEEAIVFNLFTRKDPTPTRIYAKDASSIGSTTSFDPKKKTKFVVHGYVSNAKPNSGCYLVKDAILKVADVNVILVDWSALDSGVYPVDVAVTVPTVGATISELVKALAAEASVDLDDVQLIGHSLGAQIVGAAGSTSLGPAGKGWITGLDPAGPEYNNRDPAQRLDPTDAAYVEAVHTDAGRLGIDQPVGHVDFAVNGGKQPQPDCGPDITGGCSHCFAFEVYGFAVTTPGGLPAFKCGPEDTGPCHGDEKTTLGLDPDFKSRGVFYVDSVVKPSAGLMALGRGSIVGTVVAGFKRVGPPKPPGQPDQDFVLRC